MDQEIFIRLRNLLAELYPEVDTIRRISSDSDINIRHIVFGITSQNIWHSILVEANKLGRVDSLVSVVESEYGRNPEVQRAIFAYRQSIRQTQSTHLEENARVDQQDVRWLRGEKIDLSGGLLADITADFWARRDFTSLNLSNNQLQELPPDLAQLTQLTSLNLSGNQLSEFPTLLFELPNLTELYLGNNALTKLSAEITKLPKLQRLFLGGNQLRTLPTTIATLETLEELDLNDNLLTSLPVGIGWISRLENLHLRGNKLTKLDAIVNLQRLRLLDLDSNQLTELPAELGHLRNLSSLRLRGNRLSRLPSELDQLRQLTILDIRRNEFSQLPSAIVRLPQLTTLLVNENKLTFLPVDFARLHTLKRLELANNQLKFLSSDITELTALTQLDISENQLTKLPDEIERWSNLEELLAAGNRLSALPVGLSQLKRLHQLDLRNNPLPIPDEVLSQIDDPAAIMTYYMTHQTGARRPLNEAKMLIVGQGSVGKTSLVRCLTGSGFNQSEPSTPGIAVKRWPLDIDGQTIQVNIWDFAGQEIKHATHQFFLTRRSLYLLVLNLREDERANQLEYWLKLIQSFGGDSPVIIVGNKVDENSLQLNMSGLQTKYPNIRGFMPTSCLTGQGIPELQALIKQEIAALEHVHSELLANWFDVKQALEAMTHIDYLPYEDYVRLCKTSGVDELVSQRALLELLHQLGVVLSYQEDARLQDTNILNPEWVTNGVYTILNSNVLFQQRGVLERKQLNDILDPVRYPPTKHSFLIDLMRKFELCFALESHVDQEYLVPDLLYREELDTGNWTDALPFRYDYDVLPGSIMTRFIVKMHGYIHQRTYWRTGVLLAYEGNRALVKGDIEDRHIYIWVDGPVHGRRNFLSNIRFQFDSIHKTIPGIKAAEKVPLPQHPGVVVDYRHLLNLERLNEETLIPEGLSERISVRTLLDGVVPEEERRSQRVDIRVHPDAATASAIAPPPTTTVVPAHNDPWRVGLFYLLVLVVVVVTFVGAYQFTNWYALLPILIAALIALPLIGVLQALNDGTLSEKGFLQVVIESFQRLPLLKGRTDHSSGDK